MASARVEPDHAPQLLEGVERLTGPGQPEGEKAVASREAGGRGDGAPGVFEHPLGPPTGELHRCQARMDPDEVGVDLERPIEQLPGAVEILQLGVNGGRQAMIEGRRIAPQNPRAELEGFLLFNS